MTDFESLDALEDSIARFSGIAFKAAHDQVLAAGGSVAVVQNGAVYEIFPDGRKVFIHSVKEPVRVQVSARYVRRKAGPTYEI